MPLSRGSSRLGASAAVITLLGLLFVPAPALAGPLVLEVWPCPLNADVSYALTPTSTGSAVAIDVEFDGSTRLESGYDFLHVADSMGRPVAGSPFTGSSLAGRTVRVGGPRAVLRLTTDGSDPPGLLHGFGVVSVTAVQPPASVAISTATTLPSGRVGTVYRQQLEASGTPPFTWSFLDSSPPVPGLTLTANGFLVGVPTVSGTYSFWVKADSDSQNAGVRQLSLFVKPEFGTSPVTAFDSPTSGELPVRLAVRGLDAPLREVLAILAFDPVLFDRSTSSRLAGAQDSQLYSALVGQGALMHLLTGRVASAGGNDVELVRTLFHIAAPPLPAVAPEDLVFPTLVRMETEQREVLFVLPPTADPGFDQRVTLLPDGRLAGSDPTADHLLPAATRSPSHVTLDGRRSVDPLGRTLRYQWTQLAEPPSPRPVTLSGQGRAAVVTFTTELPGDYHFALRLCNGQSCSVWAPTLVRVERLTQRAPTAHLVARNAESGSTVDETRPPLVAQVFDAIELDAGGSTDPEPLDRGHLTYLWETPSGLQLTNPTTVAPAFLPNTTGTVQLGLRVRDPGGLLSKPVTVRVSVLPRRVAPRVQVNAVSADSGETGADLGDLPVERDHPRSLRVSLQAGVVTSVTLKAVLRDADPTIPVTFSWRRLSGPEFEIFGESSSTARVRPTTPGVYELEVAVSPRGTGSDDPTKVTTRSRIRFLAETAQVHLPSATATVLTSGGAGKSGRLAASGTPPVVAAGQRVELDGRDSRATQVGRRIMTYRWEQVAGPEVVLSDPASSVLTFFAPDTHDGWSHDVVFHLYVDDGVSRSEAEPVCLRTRPPERAQGQMPLATGLNLVAFPVEPLTPSEHTLSAGPIASLLSAGCLVRTTVPACGGSSYWPLVPGLTGDFSVEPGRGYLVQLPARAGGWTPLSVDGRAWSESGHQVVLSRGVNLVGLPGRPATTVTAAQFAASTGANFVAQLVARSPGPPRFEVLWAGAAVQSQTMLATGRGYVVSVPSSRLVSLP